MLTWLIDLDNTLHNASHAVFPVMHANMNRYIANLLGDENNPADEVLVNATRMKYWQEHGATLLGLMHHHFVNPNDFLHQTHQFENLLSLLRYESGLRRLFRRLPGRKILLTNAPQHYAQQVVKHLGVHRHFDQHISIESMYIHRRLCPKPSQWLLKKLLARHGWHPHQCVLVEDTLDNLRAAKQLGMKTVWVTQYVQSKTPFRHVHFVDLKVRSVHQIPAKLSNL